jgi:hypothetical protein
MWWFSQLPLAAQLTLTQVPSQHRLVEIVTALQFMYPKSFPINAQHCSGRPKAKILF